MTDHLPIEIVEEPKVIEPEIVGARKPVSAFRGFLNRTLSAVIVALIGVVLVLIGLLLTITLVGAPMGIPLILLGLVLFCFSLFLLFGAGQTKFQIRRFP